MIDLFGLLVRYADHVNVVEIIDDRTSELAIRALEIGLSIDHAIYDCMYLALAAAENDVLVTADDVFRRKVEKTDLARHIRALAA